MNKWIRKNSYTVHFERSGGFSGMILKTVIKSETLPEEERDQLYRWISSPELWNASEKTGNTRDAFQYRIHVESEGESMTTECTDSNLPENLHSLLRYLIKKARQ